MRQNYTQDIEDSTKTWMKKIGLNYLKLTGPFPEADLNQAVEDSLNNRDGSQQEIEAFHNVKKS